MTGSQPPPPSMTATLEARAPTGSNYRARYPLTRATHEESSEMESPDCRDFLKSTSSTKMEAPACTLTKKSTSIVGLRWSRPSPPSSRCSSPTPSDSPPSASDRRPATSRQNLRCSASSRISPETMVAEVGRHPLHRARLKMDSGGVGTTSEREEIGRVGLRLNWKKRKIIRVCFEL